MADIESSNLRKILVDPEVQFIKLNNTGKDIFHSWTKDLMSPEQVTAWNKYRDGQVAALTQGKQMEQLLTLTRTPEAIRLRKWVTIMGMGEDPIAEDIKSGRLVNAPVNYAPEYMFKLPKGISVLTRDQAAHFVMFEKRQIKQKAVLGDTGPVYHFSGFILFSPSSQEEKDKIETKNAIKKTV